MMVHMIVMMDVGDGACGCGSDCRCDCGRR